MIDVLIAFLPNPFIFLLLLESFLGWLLFTRVKICRSSSYFCFTFTFCFNLTKLTNKGKKRSVILLSCILGVQQNRMAVSPGMSEAGTTAVDLYLSHKPVTEGAASSVRHHVSLPMTYCIADTEGHQRPLTWGQHFKDMMSQKQRGNQWGVQMHRWKTG